MVQVLVFFVEQKELTHRMTESKRCASKRAIWSLKFRHFSLARIKLKEQELYSQEMGVLKVTARTIKIPRRNPITEGLM